MIPTWVDAGRLILNAGDCGRLARVFAKAARGEQIVIGALGGSITEGAGASDGRKWSDIVADWFRAKFPQSRIEARNAGIGATGSLLGALRISRDLGDSLDFVTIDFCVNDKPGDSCEETMEGCVRQLLEARDEPAVALVGFVTCDGRSVQNRHLAVARHYGLPFLSVKECIWPAIESGAAQWGDWSDDNVHPHKRGHEIAGELVSGWLDGRLADWENGRRGDGIAAVPEKRVFGDSFENGRIFRPVDCASHCDGFSVATVGGRWAGALVAEMPDAKVRFEVDGTVVTLVHWRQMGPNGRARVSIDGREVAVLEGWFDATWGGYAHATTVWRGSGGRHAVDVEVLSDCAKEAAGHRFSICAIGVSRPAFHKEKQSNGTF